MKHSVLHKLLSVMMIGLIFSCTEEFEPKSETFESLLVVEATITNEFKYQEIKLSKTFKLDSDIPNPVSNAQVHVETSTGENFNFSQTEPGLFTSDDEFKAQPNESYTLKVQLSDGSSYISSSEFLPPAADLESVDTNLTIVDGVAGISIVANSQNNSSGATYFKYDYEETYKIVVPEYRSFDLHVINVVYIPVPPNVLYDLEIVPRTEDVSTCYTTFKSTDIVQTSLTDSQNSSVVDFPIRFISNDNGITRERYSIKVTQTIQSLEAYSFYRILNQLGTLENVFTNNQPGFIQGNMSSVTNASENVVGFFQVASVSSKRIYFNYSDFDIPFPPYLYECKITPLLDYSDSVNQLTDGYHTLFYSLYSGDYIYYQGDYPLNEDNLIYGLVTTECGDCTKFSSTERPAFWED